MSIIKIDHLIKLVGKKKAHQKMGFN